MHSSLIVLDAQQHLHHGWRIPDDFCFCAGDAWVPVHLQELSSALALAPLAFVVQPGAGVQLVALQGLQEGENLLVDAQGRQSGYIASIYRHYPFVLREAVAGEERKFAVCFDNSSGLYRETPDPARREERFFDNSGGPGPVLQRLVTLMRTNVQLRQQTNWAVNALAEAKLLVPWTLPLDNPHPEKSLLPKIFRIDGAALSALPGAALENLRDAGALTIAYAQLFSMPRLGLLLALHKQKHVAPPVSVDIEQLFDKKDDIFKFNF